MLALITFRVSLELSPATRLVERQTVLVVIVRVESSVLVVLEPGLPTTKHEMKHDARAVPITQQHTAQTSLLHLRIPISN
jgi:hypothetical protein